jgi:regulator of replication initiation timing
MTSKETTQDLMLQVADARIKNLVEKNKVLTLEVERLAEALNNSENNVKRVSLLMSELKLNGSI